MVLILLGVAYCILTGYEPVRRELGINCLEGKLEPEIPSQRLSKLEVTSPKQIRYRAVRGRQYCSQVDLLPSGPS